MKEFSYFPGCSLHGTSREFDESIKGVLSLLNIKIHELEDWTCCGATSAHCIDQQLAIELPARNLAIAEKDDRDFLFLAQVAIAGSKQPNTKSKSIRRKSASHTEEKCRFGSLWTICVSRRF
jgi:heterodisulfide reductase subunit B